MQRLQDKQKKQLEKKKKAEKKKNKQFCRNFYNFKNKKIKTNYKQTNQKYSFVPITVEVEKKKNLFATLKKKK